MGLLDDAIREHLELKRRRGADAEEIARQEQEALGPARRSIEPLSPDEEADLAPAVPEAAEEDLGPVASEPPLDPVSAVEDPRPVARDEPSPQEAPYGEAPDVVPADDEPEYEDEPPPYDEEPPRYDDEPQYEAPVARAAPEEDPFAARREEDVAGPSDAVAAEPVEPQGPPAEEIRPSAGRWEDPPAEPAPSREADPGGEPSGEEGGYALEDLEQPPPDPPAASDPTEEHDELEETPEFLQETPEHDRLWFEQRPPRDFDFD